ncbi:MAG TPA: IMP dehydrogenase, partial [Pseudonocardiaceae bacterium]|nr:IMP dehydrogenase [Pseudonocardiaceae bacterium]
MRDLVEIGMGRSARRAYDFDDVQIVPSRRTRSSRDVSTAWQIDAYRFDIPLVTHPTDAIVSPAMAVRIGELGGLAVLNAEGLWGRHSDVDKLLFQLASAMKEAGEAAAVRLLQQWHAAPIRAELLAEAIGQVAAAGM